jgi:hypothetical protein
LILRHKKINEEGWRYFSTILKEYQISKNQLKLAIQEGFVRVREVPNPHYATKTSRVVLENDIKNNLWRIHSLRKNSDEEKRKQKQYAIRSQRSKILENVKCPICGERCIPEEKSKSEMLKLFKDNNIDFNVAASKVIFAHVQHVHTNYEFDLKKYRQKFSKMISELMDDGCSFNDARMLVDDELGDEYDQIKNKAINKARQLMQSFSTELLKTST